MHMRASSAWYRLCLVFSLALHLPAGAATLNAAERPNILLLIADDLGYAELGCQGNTDVPTPHLDRLAAQGTRYTNGYVTAAFCSASRAGLMTGRYQNRFGYEFNPIGAQNSDWDIGLPTSQSTLADHLQRLGYATGLVGKWHLGGTAPYHPLRRGFDEFFGFLHEGHFFVPPPYEHVVTMLRRKALPDGSQGRWISSDGQLVLSTHMGHSEPAYDADNPLLRGSQPVHESTHLTDAFTREAIQFIRRHRERPFFLCVAYNAVHSPLQGDRQYFDQLGHIPDVHRRIFAAMLQHLDDSVGDVLATLDECELTNETFVCFLSDNGGPTKELTSSNLPLRGGKGEMYEGGIRVPFLVRYPTHVAAGAIEDRPVSSLDLTPTALTLAGADAASFTDLDGQSLLPSVAEPRTLYWRTGNKSAIRRGPWKLVRNGRSKNRWELYHLVEDPSETHDQLNDHAQVAQELESEWSRWNADLPAPEPLPRP
ncbi:MAG: sulfatase-like hydrolase/transferase [Planctomycetaceae bacterium]|nr:sulfatase-like hydrolase/transferase [Planctomycetaceae bacterium]